MSETFKVESIAREKIANSSGAAYGERINTYFEKIISKKLFPDNPIKAKQFQEVLKKTRDELRARQNG